MINSIQETPGVCSFIPLLYIGWADDVLSPSEVKIIREKIKEMPWLSSKEKKIINDWSNPKNPPSEELIEHWVALIKESAKGLTEINKNFLVDLGMRMAAAGSESSNVPWSTDAAKLALEEIENSLGFLDHNNFKDILSEEQITSLKLAQKKIASFDIEALTNLLDGPHRKAKNRTRQLLADPEFQLQYYADKEEYRNQTLKWTKLLAAQGAGSIFYPKEYGGEDDIEKYAAVFEILGHHDLSLAIKFGVQFGLFGGSVCWLGTKKQHDPFLNKIATGELLGCFAMTETGHGSNVRDIETTATFDPETKEFIIQTPNDQAKKEYIGNAIHGEMASVFAQLITNEQSYGVHAFLVTLRDKQGELMPGIRVEDCGYKLGLNGVDNGRIWFDQVRVPMANLLNKFGDVDQEGNYSSPIESEGRRFFTMLGTLVGGRVCVPLAGLSAAKNGLAVAIKYAARRRQFGAEGEQEKLLLDYPSHQRRLIPRLAKAYAVNFALHHLVLRFSNKTEEDSREIETLAAALKSYATWFTSDTLQECREACGGKGYLSENQFGTWKADTEVFTTFEGDNTVLFQLVAKGLLTEYKEEFNDGGVWGIVKFLTRQVVDSFSEITISDNIKESHLLSDEFQLDAFKFRERQILMSIARRLRKLISRKITPYQAVLRCQNQMLSLANAFAEKVVFEQMAKVTNDPQNLDLKPILKQLKNLYALHTIESDLSWFLESEYIAPIKSKAIRKLVDKLCLELKDHAVDLVEAFNIPSPCLNAQIIQ